MSAKDIYNCLLAAGLTSAGAGGLLGNMQAESGLQANIAQRGMTSRTDEDYTAAADMGLIDFAHDGVGYGLCQWTFWSRKKALLDFARGRGTSVGDERAQVDFCVKELREDYPALWAYLCGTEDAAKAAERICREYERPAIDNAKVRTEYAQTFFNRLRGGGDGVLEADEKRQARCWPPRMLDYREGRENLSGADVLALQAILKARGLSVPTTGAFDADTRNSVTAFQASAGLAQDGVAGRLTWDALMRR